MRIGIDGGCWTNRRGFGRFTRELVTALARRGRHEYHVLLDPDGFGAFAVPGAHPIRVGVSAPASSTATASSRRPLFDILRMMSATRRNMFDLFWFPAVYSYFPLLQRCPMLLGIHDTMADRHPELAFDSPAQRRLWRWKTKLALRQSDGVMTVSDFAKRSIESVWSVAPSRVYVVPEAPAAVFHPDPEAVCKPVILAVGGVSPNKNLLRLARAFARVQAQVPAARLVIVGDIERDGFKSSFEELKHQLDALGVAPAVTFTGFIPDEELARWYNRAAVLAFPSLEEGFGLPAVEAMACGLPVVASRAHALAEVVGDAGLLVNPLEEAEIAQALVAVLTSADLDAQLRAQSLRRAAAFTWDRSAAIMENLFERVTACASVS